MKEKLESCGVREEKGCVSAGGEKGRRGGGKVFLLNEGNFWC